LQGFAFAEKGFLGASWPTPSVATAQIAATGVYTFFWNSHEVNFDVVVLSFFFHFRARFEN
jgi:hypothetical protein